MSNLSLAISIAAQAFEGKYDKGGKPYILHCLHVMNAVEYLGETAMISGVLRDIAEDVQEYADFTKLVELGFSQEVIVILQLLTHRKETDYMAYINALSVHPIAKAIKMKDIEHNSQVTRIKGLRSKDFDRPQKYFTAYEYLKD